MNKASVMTVRVPRELKKRIDIIAAEQGVSINQLAMYMFAKEVSAFETGKQISKYWAGYNKREILNDFDEVMAKVKNRKIPEWDKL